MRGAEILKRTLGRRRLLAVGAGALGAGALGTLAATLPAPAVAEPPAYEALLLMCIDPRFVNPTNEYMLQRGLLNRYSQFALAGAAAGAVSQHWAAWHETFWDNLAASIELHSIDGVIVVNHRDCGAVQIAYGPDVIATPEIETQTHERILGTFRQEALRRHPGINVETYLMALDNSVQQIGPIT